MKEAEAIIREIGSEAWSEYEADYARLIELGVLPEDASDRAALSIVDRFKPDWLGRLAELGRTAFQRVKEPQEVILPPAPPSQQPGSRPTPGTAQKYKAARPRGNQVADTKPKEDDGKPKRVNFRADIEWIYLNLNEPTPDYQAAPSSGAASWLQEIKVSKPMRDAFLDKIVPRLVPSKSEAEKKDAQGTGNIQRIIEQLRSLPESALSHGAETPTPATGVEIGAFTGGRT